MSSAEMKKFSDGLRRVGYCRVSTHKGEQISALQGQINRIKNTGVTEIITDIESGLSDERPGMTELYGPFLIL